MVVVNETKRGQLLALLEQCAHLNADVRPRTEQGYFTVTVPPPWNGPSQRKAQEVQDRIKKWSEQYPNVICYCFDSFSTLLMCCDTGKRWHGTGINLLHAIFVNRKEFIMGYFSEMSLDMQESRKPSADRSPASAPLRRGKALTSCRCRRLTVSPYRLLKNRRRSLLLRTTEIWMRPRKSWNSLTS